MKRILIATLLAGLVVPAFLSCDKEPEWKKWYDPDWREKEKQDTTEKHDTTAPIDPPAQYDLGEKVVIPAEAEYNGVVLPSVWPPRNYQLASAEPMKCEYLTTLHPAVVPINVGRQLFVDNFLIESTNLTREFHNPEKYSGNPILKASTALEKPSSGFPGAGPKDGGIWWDPQTGVFKMWYEAGWLSSMAYATSPDGLNWTRPNLYDGTNELTSLRDLHPNSCSVVLDYDAVDGARYKMFFRESNSFVENTNHGYSMISNDGISWTNRTQTGACGDRSTMFYNPFRKKWVYSLRNTAQLGSDKYGRSRYYVESDDFLQGASWTPGNVNSVVYWCRADKYDEMDQEILASMGPGAEETAELYNVQAVAYESLMFGFHQILVDENSYAQEAGRPKVTDLKYSFSRDGFNWDRSYRDAAIASSRTDGIWDRGYVQSVGGMCSVMGDHIVIWYIGFAGNSSRPGHSAALHSNMATGAAILRRDGFAGMKGTGELLTVPVTFDGKYLFVNVSCASGSLKVEALDSKGAVIPGFEADKCRSISVDSTIQKIEWDGVNDLSALAGYAIRFRFLLTDGELYSFWVSPSEQGESRGYVGGGGPGYSSNIDDKGLKAYETVSSIYPFGK